MSVALPEPLKSVLDDRTVVTLATIQPDGSPQVTPVWVLRDGDDLLISTTVDRRKEKNLRRDPRATVSVLPDGDPYSYAEIRGTVTLTTDGAGELIDALSRKYTGQSYADFNPASALDDPRVVVRVTPVRVNGQGIV
ncbi:PPOX class F420-dependent oxidoreductase [Streptomyces avicenniae]|uniref:PPOX class F420-dependent oxidoreductase n=1 Tax=Streptomyces avicenniae TaxID=500153 RepID=UPI00069A6E47|nr:PPOX class F420-dependent oxidoreductase [Streptomyces avicenniae]